MSLVLLVLGLLAFGAGAGAIVYSVPIYESGLGNTLIAAGVTALIGGLIVIGLATAVSQLRRIAESVTSRPIPRALRPGDPLEPPVPSAARQAPRLPIPRRPVSPETVDADRLVSETRAAAPAVNVSAEAIDRLRSTFPRIDRAVPEVSVTERDEDVPLSPRAPAPRAPLRPVPAGAVTESQAEMRQPEAEQNREKSRLDFPWRSKPRAEAAAPKESIDAWPPSKQSTPMAEAPAIQPNGDKPATAGTAPSAPAPSATLSEATPTAVAILKSGVVDGMAYTLYADGSIEAKLPEGTVRFSSISELRAHLETHENQA